MVGHIAQGMISSAIYVLSCVRFAGAMAVDVCRRVAFEEAVICGDCNTPLLGFPTSPDDHGMLLDGLW